MPTARDIVTFGLKKSGVLGSGRTPEAEDINDGLDDLNDMLAQWNRRRWMVFNEVNILVTSTGADTYTAGPGGDFAMSPRPSTIKSAFLRQLVNPIGLNTDTPVGVIRAREEYDRIALKSLVSFTQFVYLETAYPLAIVRPYPVPSANIYALGLTFAEVMPQFQLDDEFDTLPAEYLPAMKFNLARRLRQAYGKGLKPDGELNTLAAEALDVIQNANLQIPQLVMPRVLVAKTPGYNILSDQWG